MRSVVPTVTELMVWNDLEMQKVKEAHALYKKTQETECVANMIAGHIKASMQIKWIEAMGGTVDKKTVATLQGIRTMVEMILSAYGHETGAFECRGLGKFVSLAVDMTYEQPCILRPNGNGDMILEWLAYDEESEIIDACPVPDHYGGIWEQVHPGLLDRIETYRKGLSFVRLTNLVY